MVSLGCTIIRWGCDRCSGTRLVFVGLRLTHAAGVGAVGSGRGQSGVPAPSARGSAVTLLRKELLIEIEPRAAVFEEGAA